MKQLPVRMVACLALIAARSYALEPAVPPSPSGSPDRAKYSVARDADTQENVFIGHYGETVRLAHLWAAEASMRGPMEVVNFHLSTVDGNLFSAPFQPKPADYAPENFKRLRLMQMLVIPKNVDGGFRSLDKLREAKTKELAALGSPYELHQVGEYPWPPGSFWISISTPYQLFQLYTQSDKNIFILTSGANPYDKIRDDPILENSTSDLTNSISTYLDAFSDKLIAEKTFVYDLRIAVLPWIGVCIFAALLGFLPKQLRRLRRIGRGAFAFTTSMHLLAAPLLFASWRLGLDRTINEASLLLCAGLAMPWVCRAVSARLGGQRPWRVFLWSATANMLPVVAGWTVMQDFLAGTRVITGYQDFWMLSCVLSTVGLLNAIAFGLAHRSDAE